MGVIRSAKSSRSQHILLAPELLVGGRTRPPLLRSGRTVDVGCAARRAAGCWARCRGSPGSSDDAHLRAAQAWSAPGPPWPEKRGGWQNDIGTRGLNRSYCSRWFGASKPIWRCLAHRRQLITLSSQRVSTIGYFSILFLSLAALCLCWTAALGQSPPPPEKWDVRRPVRRLSNRRRRRWRWNSADEDCDDLT